MNDIDTNEEQPQLSVPATPAAPSSTVSQRKREANRANAQRSTGPRTERGKRHSRRNALKHGCLSERILFSTAGEVIDPALHEYQQALLEFYGDDVRSRIRIEQLIVNLWRQNFALEADRDLRARYHRWPFEADPEKLGCLHRYNTASLNAVSRQLEALDDYLVQGTAHPLEAGEGPADAAESELEPEPEVDGTATPPPEAACVSERQANAASVASSPEQRLQDKGETTLVPEDELPDETNNCDSAIGDNEAADSQTPETIQ